MIDAIIKLLKKILGIKSPSRIVIEEKNYWLRGQK